MFVGYHSPQEDFLKVKSSGIMRPLNRQAPNNALTNLARLIIGISQIILHPTRVLLSMRDLVLDPQTFRVVFEHNPSFSHVLNFGCWSNCSVATAEFWNVKIS